MFTPINAAKTLILIMFSITRGIYCTSVRPGRGIPHMWLSLRFLLSFYLLKGFFSSFSLLLLRVKGRGCHTLLKPYETNCGLWIWAIQIKFDWLIESGGGRRRSDVHSRWSEGHSRSRSWYENWFAFMHNTAPSNETKLWVVISCCTDDLSDRGQSLCQCP